jgi:predicted nuclease with TOPRIM domain
MASSGAIKVNRTALINKLEEAKADLEKKQARLEQLDKDFNAELDKWREGAKKHIIEISSHRYNSTYEAKISDAYIAKYPKKKPFDPKNPNIVEPSWSIKQDIKNLSETLAMLKLSEEQTVSQSMLKNLAQYLA